MKVQRLKNIQSQLLRSSLLRSVRVFLLPLLAVLGMTSFAAGLLLAAPAPATQSHLGQTLALRAALHTLVPAHRPAKTFQELGVPATTRRGPDGRYIYSKGRLMHAGAIRSRAAGSALPQVDEAVQTFDVFNPPPAFTPSQPLTPTNLTPVWTADETMLVFSSNRTASGGVGTRFHIWAIPINGGAPVQLTTSVAANGETSGIPHGEFFPALSANNNQALAFTSDAKSANVQNLYVVPFTATSVDLASPTLVSPTMQGNDAGGNPVTGFGNVGRPVFSPGNPDQILFAATSMTGTYQGHSHLYFLYLSTKGYDPGNASLPAKITDGPADDTDPAYSQDGLAIAFSSTAGRLTTTNQAVSSAPNTSLIATSAAGATRNVFVIGGGGAFGFGTVLNGGAPVTTIGADDYGPAWSSTRRNTYTNPAGGQEYLSFARGGASQSAPHDIYSLQVLQTTAAGVPQVLAESTTNTAVALNTNDTGNSYDDIYPTWSPFISIYSIAFSSNRTVTYTTPAGTASETAISVPRTGSLNTTTAVGAQYAGILESQFINLDPPTLLPYSGNEIIHVADSSGATTRYGITPGQPVTFTVRLSSREAGVDSGNVYLQIKDPDSKYQDAQGLEHKVFAKDAQFSSQSNAPAPALQDSGSSALLMNGGGYDASGGEGYAGFNQFTINSQLVFFSQRGSIGGVDGLDGGTTIPTPTSNTFDTISIGKGGGGTNSYVPVDASGKPVIDTNKAVAHEPGTDPTAFIPWGPEYECQVVNPQFGASGGVDTLPTDYRSPFYLAGIDDQQAFSGANKARPITGTSTTPAEWLKLSLAPAGQQDGQGGLLYTVNWTTPVSGSDYYLDVIAFDKAVAPATYAAAQAAAGSTTGSNWRIYDNVWGFSTAASIGNNDILVVSDYALGQKFAASTFGGQRGLLNLVPKLYGAESYVTDVDINILPDSIYRYFLFPGADPKNFRNYQPIVLNLNTAYDLTNSDAFDIGFDFKPLNALGVDSYNDTFIDDGGRKDGAPYVRSQQYSIWRILSRGPVPASVYRLYEPTIETQPAVADTSAKITIPAGKVAVANRCILWISPFTGDVLAGAGTIADTQTQTALRSFVGAGGRLLVSGPDVASSLTQNGAANNAAGGFVFDVLNAALLTSGGGTHIVKATGTSSADNRLTNVPSYDGHLTGNYPELNPGDTDTNVTPGQRQILISNNFGGSIFYSLAGPLAPITPNYSGNWRTDASLDQLGPYLQPFPATSNNSVLAQIDTVTPGKGAHLDANLAPFTNPLGTTGFGTNDPNAATSPGGAGLIYTESPFTATGGTGSKVVYATFGLEALSTEFYSQKFVNDTGDHTPSVYVPRNQRQNILHNIVDYLRTGSITGTVRATTGNGTAGAGIAGATVYLQSAYGVPIPNRGTYSATTDSSGNFIIDGIEPGNYTLVAYREGYLRTTSNPGVVFVIEGDTTQQASLTLSQAPPGSITGQVTDSGKNPVAGATVSFTSASGQSYAATTDANGNYTLASIPPSTYTGAASKTGYGTAVSASTVVASGGSVTVSFVLVAGQGLASGIVTDTSSPPVGIGGATVFFSGNGLATPKTATTLGDGSYITPSLPAGTYTVAASATGYGTSTPISVTIVAGTTTPVPAIQLGTAVNGTLGGLVTASGSSSTTLSGAAISIVNPVTGQTITPSPVSTTATTAAPDGTGPINYGPVSLPQGTYTVTATENGVASASQSVVVPPNGFARADFTGSSGLQPVHTFPSGLQFVSTPFDYSALQFNGLFGTLNTALSGQTPNGNRSNVAVWNPLTGAYALDPNAPADALRAGAGYWVSLAAATPVLATGTPYTGSIQVALNPSWNQIGVPNPAGVPVSSLTFTGTNGTTYSFADATGSTYHLVQATLYSYDGTVYQPVASGATLQPWQAYWIRVFTPVTLNIPTGH